MNYTVVAFISALFTMSDGQIQKYTQKCLELQRNPHETQCNEAALFAARTVLIENLNDNLEFIFYHQQRG